MFLEVLPDSRGIHLRWGFFLNKLLRRDSWAGVFSWIGGIFGSTWLEEHKRLFLHCFWSTIIINISSWICRTSFSFGMFSLLLLASTDIKYPRSKCKTNAKCFIFFFSFFFFIQVIEILYKQILIYWVKIYKRQGRRKGFSTRVQNIKKST